MATKYLVQNGWLTELPTMEKPVGHGFPTNESYRKFKENKYEYDQHLATLPKICCCEGLKDGAIVEEGVDFEMEEQHDEGDGNAPTYAVNPVMVAIPLHREQGVYDLSQPHAELSFSPSTPAGKEEIRLYADPTDSDSVFIRLVDGKNEYKIEVFDKIVCAHVYHNGEKLLSTSKEYEPNPKPSPQSEQAAENWQQVISDRINYFATHHHKFESKELHDALNVILRLVPPALWQAASQEKAKLIEETVRQIAWIAWKGAANAYRLYPENKHTFTGYWDAAKNQFQEWFVPAPDTVQGQEELWLDVYDAITLMKDHNISTEDSIKMFDKIKSTFTLTKNS